MLFSSSSPRRKAVACINILVCKGHAKQPLVDCVTSQRTCGKLSPPSHKQLDSLLLLRDYNRTKASRSTCTLLSSDDTLRRNQSTPSPAHRQSDDRSLCLTTVCTIFSARHSSSLADRNELRSSLRYRQYGQGLDTAKGFVRRHRDLWWVLTTLTYSPGHDSQTRDIRLQLPPPLPPHNPASQDDPPRGLETLRHLQWR